ncbi:MAG: CDGSH iron-sulfur domain-containing protein [Usitatibacter sp.]
MSDAAKPARGGKLPVMARLGPYEVVVKEGTTYRWCSCGLSATQPWCDDSHEGTGMEPIEFVAPLSAVFHMCGCKNSDNKPYCFGTCRGHRRPAPDG